MTTTPLSPNSRQRKIRLSLNLYDIIVAKGVHTLPKDEQVQVVKHLIRKLGLQNKFVRPSKPTNAGRKLTLFDTRSKVWEFWHEMSDASTNSTRPAKLKTSCKSKIQSNLSFLPSTQIMSNKRGTKFYTSTWKITTLTYKELYLKFISTYPEQKISYGTFIALKPFYVRAPTKSDIEMCCCKTHLHARWSVSSLASCCKKQNIALPFTGYYGLFDFLWSDCEKSDTMFVAWECCKDKTELCKHADEKWTFLKNEILEKEDKKVCVSMEYFDRESTGKVSAKTGKEITILKARKIATKFIRNCQVHQ